MTDQDIHPNKFSELRSIHKHYIDSYIALYQLKTEKEEELNSIYKMIKTELIDSKVCLPKSLIKDILNIIPYNNRYKRSYLFLAKLICDEYHVEEVNHLMKISNFLFYKEYGIKLDKSKDFREINSENLDIHTENTVYRAILYNDLEKFIFFTEREEFDKDQTLKSSLYPSEIVRYLLISSYKGYSLLELCCYHGAVDCFKLLRTKFNSEITYKCLKLSFLGRNQEILSECLKYQKPDYYCMECMEYAIISHNIDFVTFLMNEYSIPIDLEGCGRYNNLESFLVYFDRTNDFNECFNFSTMFNIPSLCEYFLSNGANINEKDINGLTALHFAARYNSNETAELLISHGININEKDKDGKTALHNSAENNSKETAELLISHGININEKNYRKETALHAAARCNSIKTAELLISHGININEKNKYGKTALHYAADNYSKEIAEVLISHGININEKDNDGKTALHYAAEKNSKETAELLISHGININEKDNFGQTALHNSAENNSKETAELLISHGININEKDEGEKPALHIAVLNNSKEIVELLISHGAKI
ncbi:hypothetical protein TVAG_453680 [Trichomonas vaginalis G3]|uniref:DUF3447 domain-containing protein n=1 Tax=Trichomonas vaginalis (strain ATCC PRA-98 / G3) TaxID=412133 RepID=A2DPU4_TRIV3|nr:ankyrin repeat and SOCS box-containing protein 4 family [Trichomonas vaginalis G3]EAY17540.1 hypothetical protein TVAG_453680 [Trichomonas vaginalis G3]KAI5520584.1 ankyrin repeat and SOCS box-containing protein 4 family [Trichomonas vaginalis G3]|eukprot:XP_001329675.1 hypothetical protein [Trichomonas vaginalis G3]